VLEDPGDDLPGGRVEVVLGEASGLKKSLFSRIFQGFHGGVAVVRGAEAEDAEEHLGRLDVLDVGEGADGGLARLRVLGLAVEPGEGLDGVRKAHLGGGGGGALNDGDVRVVQRDPDGLEGALVAEAPELLDGLLADAGARVSQEALEDGDHRVKLEGGEELAEGPLGLGVRLEVLGGEGDDASEERVAPEQLVVLGEQDVGADLGGVAVLLPLDEVVVPEAREAVAAAELHRAAVEGLVAGAVVALDGAGVVGHLRRGELELGEAGVDLADGAVLTQLPEGEDRGEERMLGDGDRTPSLEALLGHLTPEIGFQEDRVVGHRRLVLLAGEDGHLVGHGGGSDQLAVGPGAVDGLLEGLQRVAPEVVLAEDAGDVDVPLQDMLVDLHLLADGDEGLEAVEGALPLARALVAIRGLFEEVDGGDAGGAGGAGVPDLLGGAGEVEVGEGGLVDPGALGEAAGEAGPQRAGALPVGPLLEGDGGADKLAGALELLGGGQGVAPALAAGGGGPAEQRAGPVHRGEAVEDLPLGLPVAEVPVQRDRLGEAVEAQQRVPEQEGGAGKLVLPHLGVTPEGGEEQLDGLLEAPPGQRVLPLAAQLVEVAILEVGLAGVEVDHAKLDRLGRASAGASSSTRMARAASARASLSARVSWVTTQ
jgi:hypothetical protein